MARKSAPAEIYQDTPVFPTAIRYRYRGDWRDGLIKDADGRVWMCRAIPMSPVSDAKTLRDRSNAALPLINAYNAVAMLTAQAGRRALLKSGYRDTQLMVVNVPQWWTPPRDHPLADYLATMFPRTLETRARTAVIAVLLRDSVTSGGLQAAVDSVAATLIDSQVPIGDYESDARKVSAGLARAGLTVPTREQMRYVEAWWNNGHSPDVHVMPQADCLHVFSTSAQAQAAARALDEGRTQWEDLSPSATITMAAVCDFEYEYSSSDDPSALWMTQLLDEDALVVSVRAKVEPAKVTRTELRRWRKRNLDDARERDNQARAMDREEQSSHIDLLGSVEAAYASSDATPPATLVDAAVTVGFSGYVPDLEELAAGMACQLDSIPHRQRALMAETMLGSSVRANYHLQDLPAQVIACSGAPGLSIVGDRPDPGTVLIGHSERDRQAAWYSPMAAHDQDGLPITVVAGATGSGKSVLALWIADQLARQGMPSVFIDPKPESDHSAAVLAAGGQVYSLDSLMHADGAFDPIALFDGGHEGVSLAASVLSSINPWGPDRDRYEIPIIEALNHGVRAGARTTGAALRIALRDGVAPKEMVASVFKLADALPMFRACFGVEPVGKPMSVAQGITYIKVGSASLELPAPGAQHAQQSLPQRVSLAVVRMMVYGSAAAMTNRDGTIMLDEGWVFTSAGRDEMERLGRLARSQRVAPMLFTQRITDALNAGLRGYISRTLILPIQDEEEARAACELAKLEPTPERIERITGEATIGGASGGVEPNWTSMRALYDPKAPPGTRTLLRGTVALYSDLAGRCVPVVINLAQAFLNRASTNKADIVRRKQEAQAALEAAQRDMATSVSSGAPSVEDIW